MKQLTEYTRASGYLVKIFGYLNETYFENALSKPVITIQSTPRAYGHVSVSKVWETEKGSPRHELNIGAGTLSRPIENVVATMLHEMVHIYCLQNNIKDTSRGYAYHNKRFKEEAEKRDLHIEYDSRIGYSITSPTDNLLTFCLRYDLEDIQLNRTEGFRATPPTNGGAPSPAPATPTKAPTSTRKYQCPRCRCSVRATRDLLLICGQCDADGERVFLEKA